MLFRRPQALTWRSRKAIWRLSSSSRATSRALLTTATLSVRRPCTNPSLVFDNGVAHPATPVGQEHFLESPLQDHGTIFWSADPALDRTSHGELFFDQVAELEKVISGDGCRGTVLGKPWSVNGELYNVVQESVGDGVSLVEGLNCDQAVDACSCRLPVGEWCSMLGQNESPCIEEFEQQATDHSSTLSNGKAASFDDSQGSPSSVGSSCSDEASEKRIRNNQASRKFRRVRKERHKTLFAKASKLAQENHSLKLQVNEMMREVISLRSMLPKSTLEVKYVSA